MASGSNLARDEKDEDQGETIINMVDYLKEEEALEDDAHAVLGGSDEHHCTYPVGYVGRQALYACSTCSANKTPAGICLACSYDCHEGHDLYELYTKRNFRCDCGNKKFGETKCKLYPDKEEYNSQNHYNHNFEGLYCTCGRPYPDPEDEVEDEMIQCIICEDWYHGRHLGAEPPSNSDYQEMTCGGCMNKHEFLWTYSAFSRETVTVKSEDTVEKVDVEKTDKDGVTSAGNPIEDTKPKADSSESEKETCLLKELQQREVIVKDCAVFWPEGFRSKLCTCKDCMDLYRDHNLLYLTDESDTVAVYEKKGMEKRTPSTHQDRERQALQGMNHTQQIEMLQGFNDMKSELSEYLKHFAENGKVVREEDIREFFTQMQARKRQRTDNVPGYFCR